MPLPNVILIDHPVVQTKLTELREGSGSVLEVGSYVGGFLAAAGALGWDAEGVDVNPATNAATRERGFRVHDGTLETWAGTPGLDAVWGYEPSFENMQAIMRIFAYDQKLVGDHGQLEASHGEGKPASSEHERMEDEHQKMLKPEGHAHPMIRVPTW